MPAARTLIKDALIEIGVCAENDDPAAEDADRGLRILNRDIVDPWNAQRQFATTRVITSGTFTASAASRTVGPSGNYALTPRPIALLSARRVDGTTRYDLNIRDEAWYAALELPAFTSVYMTDIAYFPTVPTGTMYPWPVPTGNTTVEIETLSVLSQFATLDTSADFAPGYESAICQTLKELFCRAWHRPLPEGLARDAARARAVVQILNVSKPRRLISDAPGTASRPVGSDSIGFRNRDF